eukprot:TRINITY_DN125942_c0_g1_i1.p1 TRINITY_DN125942_c0_g1~~TRINITY_DN125942_c0_g1_i1.p1  ORF type:complete len:455 (-),score=130.35 TRINITY_DN125942_c0_g1_i1:151-1515(-)
MAMATGGLSVATTADLNQALGAMEDKFDTHRRWTENQISDFIMKLRNGVERIDSMERDQSTSLEAMNTDLKALRAGCVANSLFRQSMNQLDKRLDQEREEVDQKMEHLKMALEKDITTNISNLRLKAETLNANCIALTEKSKVIEETLLPSVRTELEEQKQKRLAESQRLESEIEKMKEVCEQKISHTAAALRFYVTATATKLREELTPATTTMELESDLKHKEADLRKFIKSVEDTTAVVRDQVSKQREYLDTTIEKYTIDIGQCTKSMKVMEITMQNLQNSVATDLSDVREEVRNDVSKMKMDVSDTRATSQRSCSANENAIQAVASEINPLRNFRELILERLHIEKFVNLVREWQTTTIPQVSATSKDLDERMKKVQNSVSSDHQTIVDLTRSISEVRRHFKMFHAIAAGLDDKPHPGMGGDGPGGSADDRLPPIHTARSFGGGAADAGGL